MNEYQTLAELKSNESEHDDWRQPSQNRESWLVVVAPHGKTIEPGTETIAKEIAGDSYSCFIFEGLRHKIEGRKWLHVSSERFRDPALDEIQANALVTLSLHGAADRDTVPPKVTHLGGNNIALRELVWGELKSRGFDVVLASGALAGTSESNFVNATRDKGVQVEISKSQRNEFSSDEQKRALYVYAFRSAIEAYDAQMNHQV